MSSFISQNLTEIEEVTPYLVCSLVYKLTGSHFISSAFEIPSILYSDRNLSSSRGPGYSPQYGIAPTNAWFFLFVSMVTIC